MQTERTDHGINQCVRGEPVAKAPLLRITSKPFVVDDGHVQRQRDGQEKNGHEPIQTVKICQAGWVNIFFNLNQAVLHQAVERFIWQKNR